MAKGHRNAIEADEPIAVTFEQFCRETGYDPKTRRYRRSPRVVPGAHALLVHRGRRRRSAPRSTT